MQGIGGTPQKREGKGSVGFTLPQGLKRPSSVNLSLAPVFGCKLQLHRLLSSQYLFVKAWLFS